MSEEKCGAKCRDGSPCGNYPVTGSNRCRMHGGKGSGNPDAEGAGITHGATADPTNLYDHLDDEDRAWVDDLTDAYIEQSPYSEGDPQTERIQLVVVMAWQERSGRAQLIKEGLEREKVVSASEAGVARDLDDHHLNSVVSSLNSDIRMNLKDLGLLNDPETAKADALGQIAVEVNRTHVTEANVDEHTGN